VAGNRQIARADGSCFKDMMIRLVLATTAVMALGSAAIAQTSHHHALRPHTPAVKQRAEELKPLKGLAFLLGSASACGVVSVTAAQNAFMDKFDQPSTIALKLSAYEKQDIDSIYLTAQHDAVAAGDCAHWHKDTALTAAVRSIAEKDPASSRFIGP
jgi:hypothetical protein